MMRRSRVKKIILVLVGEKLSGKEMASRYLVKRYGFKPYRFSKILVDILNCLKLPVTRVNEMNLVGGLRERFGAGVLAATLTNLIKQQPASRVVVDGLRHPAEYEVLSKLSGFTLVYITASLLTRFKRARARGEKVGEEKFTLEQFKREEQLPTEIYIKRLGIKAAVKIANEESLAELYQQVEAKIVKKYLR